MSRRSFANRRELEEHSFHPAVMIAVPLVALFLHSYLPRIWAPFSIVDLPLIVVLYFAISWRSPLAGTFMGAGMGLLQDTLTNQYIGVNGIAKTIVGFMAASIGLRVDVENVLTRVLMNFSFCLLQSALLFVVERVLLGEGGQGVHWVHEVLRAAINAAVAVPIFFLLDRARQDEIM